MKVERKFVAVFLLLALLFTEACNKKRNASLPAQAAAPTVVVALPDEIPENPETPPAEVAQAPVVVPTVKTKPKKSVHATAKKSTPPPTTATAQSAAPPPASSDQTVASLRPPHNAADSAPDIAIAVAIPSQQVSKRRDDTAHMVDSTENALKNLNRSLTDEEKGMLTQIQSYLQQSRKATADGDLERAYKLAQKAQLLADALIKK